MRYEKIKDLKKESSRKSKYFQNAACLFHFPYLHLSASIQIGIAKCPLPIVSRENIMSF